MKTIKLYGHLGKQFGKIHKYYVKTPAQAIRLLTVNYKDFEKSILDFDGLGYRIIIGNTEIGVDDLGLTNSSEVIKIVPIISGQGGGGWGTIILGAALMIAAPYAAGFVAQMGAATAAGTGAAMSAGWVAAVGFTSSVMAGYGMALVLGGISEILYSPPDASGAAKQASPGSFDGAVNTSRQGMPIAIGYGQLTVGSAVISGGISTVSVPV